MNAMGEPGARAHPAGLLDQVDRPHAVDFEAKLLFLLGLAKMRMQLAIVALGKARRIRHQPPGHRERRARRERDADFGAGPGSWNSFSTRSLSATIVSSSCTIRRAAGRRLFATRLIEPRVTVIRSPSFARLLDLDVDRVLQPRRKHIMMIGRGGAARQQQFGQAPAASRCADGPASSAPRSAPARRAKAAGPG